jgi:hypothetical protein
LTLSYLRVVVKSWKGSFARSNYFWQVTNIDAGFLALSNRFEVVPVASASAIEEFLTLSRSFVEEITRETATTWTDFRGQATNSGVRAVVSIVVFF